MFKTRPIVVGSLLYRSWAKLRFAEIAKMLGRILLGPLQAGGLPTHDAETLLLSFTEEFTTSSHPFGISLDYAKAFDSSDHEVASALLNWAGVPGGVMRALTAIWKHHDRWISYGGLSKPSTKLKYPKPQPQASCSGGCSSTGDSRGFEATLDDSP